MGNKIDKKSISKLLSKGLTGREAGKLIMQDFFDEMYGKKPLLNRMKKVERKGSHSIEHTIFFKYF